MRNKYLSVYYDFKKTNDKKKKKQHKRSKYIQKTWTHDVYIYI